MDEKHPISNIIVENRRRITVSGVVDVISFDEESVILDTSLGAMVLKGEEFKINKLNIEAGEFMVEGNLLSIAYDDNISKEKVGFMARLFR
ncbi:MAG: sporulation protein YabP [Eubacteriales bacterium]|nr:sporulation protein YabP [Eubacteriales bacterium]